MANNQIVISRIQHRRGRRENLPQPLRPGEIALTADTEQVWIGGDPELAPAGIRIYNDKSTTTAQAIINTYIAEIKFVQDFTPTSYASLVTSLTNSSVVTLVPEDIIWDDEYIGSILTISISNAGTGYTNGTYPLTIVSSTGTGATATATVSGGTVTSVTVTNGGRNYQAGNTTISLSGAGSPSTPTVLGVGASNIHGYSVFVGLDIGVDPDNTIANIDSEVSASPVSTRKIETHSVGSQTIATAGHAPPNAATPRLFFSRYLSMESHSAAAAVARLINRVNSSTPNEITGIAHTDLNIEIGTASGMIDHNHPYDMAFFIGGTADTINIQVGAFLVTRNVSVLAAAGHLAKCETAADATVVYPIKKNGTSVGTVTFLNGNTTGTVVITADFVLIPGDILQVFAPTSTNTAIENVVITIVGCATAVIC
jgi:hypothetical protein